MIYTSYFSNLKNLKLEDCLSIAIGTPTWYNGLIYKELQPTWDMVMGRKKGIMTREEYIRLYQNDILNKLNPQDIIDKLDNKILLCWCGKNKFCHRQLVLEWLNKYKQNSCIEI